MSKKSSSTKASEMRSEIVATAETASIAELGGLRFRDFREAANAVLKFLHARHGFELWMVTRTEGEDWIVLSAEDHGYGVKDGDVFRWADTFCCEMVEGRGPRVASDCRKEPAYSDRPIGKQVPIGSYIGTPLSDEDGNLFGTLCGIDPNPRDDSLIQDLPLVELLGGLLNSLLVTEMKASTEMRRFERTEFSERIDSETGLFSAAGWQRVLAAEEIRCQRFGHSAVLAFITIADGPRVADVASLISQFVTADETAARIGERCFSWLGPEYDQTAADERLSILVERLTTSQIDHVIRHGRRNPRSGLNQLAAELNLSVDG